MALTGICLVLFVTFHVLMNAVAIFWPTAYNEICIFLGANWYALIASAGLGLLMVIHIIYAVILTIQNRKARGNNRYKISATPKSVEWSSQNMLVLGIVVVAFLVVHLVQFWAKMQAQEVLGSVYSVNGVEVMPQAGTLFIQLAFQQVWTPIIYIIGFVALWFHMNHGFWSMLQSVGWNNQAWLPRIKCIGNAWVTIVIGLFTIQAVVFTVRAMDKYYVEDPDLMQQYAEMYNKHYEHELENVVLELQAAEREREAILSNNELSTEEKAAATLPIESKLQMLNVKGNEIYGKMMQISRGSLYDELPKIAEVQCCFKSCCKDDACETEACATPEAENTAAEADKAEIAPEAEEAPEAENATAETPVENN